MANSIARTWVERLQRDAMQWTLPSPENPTGNNIASAAIVGTIVGGSGTWFLPTQAMAQVSGTQTMSPAFDILGRDLPQTSFGTADFCVNVRLPWLTTTNTPPDGDLIRADVRVLWPMGVIVTLPDFCNDHIAAETDPNTDSTVIRAAGDDPSRPALHALYLTTTIRENASP